MLTLQASADCFQLHYRIQVENLAFVSQLLDWSLVFMYCGIATCYSEFRNSILIWSSTINKQVWCLKATCWCFAQLICYEIWGVSGGDCECRPIFIKLKVITVIVQMEPLSEFWKWPELLGFVMSLVHNTHLDIFLPLIKVLERINC